MLKSRLRVAGPLVNLRLPSATNWFWVKSKVDEKSRMVKRLTPFPFNDMPLEKPPTVGVKLPALPWSGADTLPIVISADAKLLLPRSPTYVAPMRTLETGQRLTLGGFFFRHLIAPFRSATGLTGLLRNAALPLSQYTRFGIRNERRG
jgi:hypothetical protein